MFNTTPNYYFLILCLLTFIAALSVICVFDGDFFLCFPCHHLAVSLSLVRLLIIAGSNALQAKVAVVDTHRTQVSAEVMATVSRMARNVFQIKLRPRVSSHVDLAGLKNA